MHHISLTVINNKVFIEFQIISSMFWVYLLGGREWLPDIYDDIGFLHVIMLLSFQVFLYRNIVIANKFWYVNQSINHHVLLLSYIQYWIGCTVCTDISLFSSTLSTQSRHHGITHGGHKDLYESRRDLTWSPKILDHHQHNDTDITTSCTDNDKQWENGWRRITHHYYPATSTLTTS